MMGGGGQDEDDAGRGAFVYRLFRLFQKSSFSSPGVIPRMIDGLFAEKQRLEQEPLQELQAF